MNLLLQLNGDLPDRFPGHERRLYIFACRRKPCQRKDGSVRGFRACRQTATTNLSSHNSSSKEPIEQDAPNPSLIKTNLGETLFGIKPQTVQTNPFAIPKSNIIPSNPFSSAPASVMKAEDSQTAAQNLPETFAQKACISSPEPKTAEAVGPWPEQSAFPKTHPLYHVDADKEYIDSETQTVPAHARLDRSAIDGEGSGSAADEKAAFESSMDKTFQRFADRLAQNPEQVLRYEYAGEPLLYSKSDAIGKLLSPRPDDTSAKVRTQNASNRSRIPRCTNCGAERTFELQLTPHAIIELEADEISVDGMDWGTIIFGVCSKDCVEGGKGNGTVGYLEEWVGVQWEEVASK